MNDESSSKAEEPNVNLQEQLAESMRANNLLDAATKKAIAKPESKGGQVGSKEFKAMKKSGYNDNKDDLDTSYVIQNKKTKAIVEVKALSPIMAAKTVGWRPRHTKVLQINRS